MIVDPSLFIPLSLRPPLALGETEETRKNLRLESTHGYVNADVTLVEKTNIDISSSSKRNSRVKMQMRSTHGGIAAKIVSFSAYSLLSLSLNIFLFLAWTTTQSHLICT